MNIFPEKTLLWNLFLQGLVFYFICFFGKGHKKGANVNIAVYFEFIITAVCTLIFKHFSMTPLTHTLFFIQRTAKVWKSQVRFLHLCSFSLLTKKKKEDRHSSLFTLLSLSPCSFFSSTPLVVFFFSSLCPGSHYCFGKYFIGLNTFAHSHLPAASPLSYTQTMDRQIKMKESKVKVEKEEEKEVVVEV